MDIETEAKSDAIRHEVLRKIESDRTPMEAAVGRLDESVSRLDALLREHSERLAPILREGGSEESGMARAGELCSERVRQLHFMGDRIDAASDYLQDLTARVEA